eukprot:CAMPEP_0206239350 /NCGR_PEP_ID=MMETSP0047_2-20121206/15331_1 /ASSEMBLY_ACC=CAM_ASM_000192 /TAXON_ID=195065 /ORGANISM="Chroomonas mesostigmatica_cf, Strain CCMP1168" /LENGTH=66 /DNA_ID=CAMNT_0053664005 /DNA_START=42 /DNA_END=242 /DNA_ORIENTATION=-
MISLRFLLIALIGLIALLNVASGTPLCRPFEESDGAGGCRCKFGDENGVCRVGKHVRIRAEVRPEP